MSTRTPSNKLYPLEIIVRRTIQKEGMLVPGEHVLVAVSGGADSVALLHCLHRLAPSLRLSLTIAHLNHRIRGSEGDADEDFVRCLCADLNIPFSSETIEVKQKAASSGRNLEELARQIRYDFLRRTAHEVGAQKIAVGHNLNDQAETILFRLFRGSGIEGLSAIYPVVDDLVIRPLLECPRSSILAYLEQKGVSHREDSTNDDLRHARNRIRRELMPFLEKNFNPQLAATLAREALIVRETWSFVESQGMDAFERLHCRQDQGISLDLKGLVELHSGLQRQVLRQAIKETLGSLQNVTARLIESILALSRTGSSGDQIRMPRRGIALRQFDRLLLLNRLPPPAPSFTYRLDIPGKCHIAEAGIYFKSRISSAPDLKIIKKGCARMAFLEPSSLPQFLSIRPRKMGDRYGGPGHRKVKKLLIDRKIPLLQRPVVPMIVAGNDVIWIPGFRPARNYEAQPGSERCVVIEIVQGAE